MTIIEKHQLKPIMTRLKEEGFSILISINAQNSLNGLELSYILYNPDINSITGLEILVGEQTQSVCDLYKSANFEEREIYDMFGIKFEGHPNLKRILLSENWLDHPLKKDYQFNDARLDWNRQGQKLH